MTTVVAKVGSDVVKQVWEIVSEYDTARGYPEKDGRLRVVVTVDDASVLLGRLMAIGVVPRVKSLKKVSALDEKEKEKRISAARRVAALRSVAVRQTKNFADVPFEEIYQIFEEVSSGNQKQLDIIPGLEGLARQNTAIANTHRMLLRIFGKDDVLSGWRVWVRASPGMREVMTSLWGRQISFLSKEEADPYQLLRRMDLWRLGDVNAMREFLDEALRLGFLKKRKGGLTVVGVSE